MKYVLHWKERSWGSAADAEAAQARVLGMMQHWTPPDSITFHQFLVRVGEYGGFAVIETDDTEAVHQLTSTFAVFDFALHPVLDIGPALGAEGAALAWRDGLASKGN